MTRIMTAGAEFASRFLDGLEVAGAGITYVTSPVRSGQYAFSIPMASGQYLQSDFASVVNRWYYLRFWFQVSALPTATRNILSIKRSTSVVGHIEMRTNGRLAISIHPSTPTLSAPVTPGKWHHGEIAMRSDGTTRSFRARLDGVQFDGFDTTTSGDVVINGLYFGNIGTVTGETSIVYYDDLALNEDSGGDENSWPSATGKIVNLRPVADVAVGNWKLGAGTTPSGNAWDSVDNVPPQGVANASATDARQIRNTSTVIVSPGSDIDIRLEPYSARVPPKSKIKLVRARAGIGRTGAVALSYEYGLIANPAETPVLRNYTELTNSSTFATNWERPGSTVIYDPAVSLSDQPVLRMSKRTASVEAEMCCAMGLVVEYEPSRGQNFIGVA